MWGKVLRKPNGGAVPIRGGLQLECVGEVDVAAARLCRPPSRARRHDTQRRTRPTGWNPLFRRASRGGQRQRRAPWPCEPPPPPRGPEESSWEGGLRAAPGSPRGGAPRVSAFAPWTVAGCRPAGAPVLLWTE